MPLANPNDVLRFLNTVSDPLMLVDAFLQAADMRITAQQATCILNYRKRLPARKFTSLKQLEGHCGLNKTAIDRLGRPQAILHAPTKNCPVLLFPVRLETRFIDNDLCIRIYPDRISIETHEQKLTQREFELGMYYREIHTSGPEEARRDAWRRLVHLFGPQRAAWVRRTVLALPRGRKPLLKEKSWTEAPRLCTLPDKFAVYLYREGNLVKGPMYGKQIPYVLTMFASPQTPNPGLFDAGSDWVVDFNKAEACGMALRIPFNDEEMNENREKGFSRVIAVGIRLLKPAAGRHLLEGLIDNHHYTAGGFAFIERGTPTNNTQKTKAGNPKSDPSSEGSYRIEVEGPPRWDSPPPAPETNAQRLGHALGLGMQPEALRHIAGSDDMRDSYSKDMRTALWPATGDYFLRTMLTGLVDSAGLKTLAEHFAKYVDAGGRLPSIRTGDQPYGILAVSTIFSRDTTHAGTLEQLDPSKEKFPASGSFDDKLLFFLRKFAVKWLRYAHNPELVPRVNATDDPDKELLQLLTMEPASITYQARPFVDERFISYLLVALRDFAFGPGTPYDAAAPTPLFWVQQWANIWEEQRRETAAVLKDLSGASIDALLDKPLLKIIGWWDGISRPLPYAEGEEPYDSPSAYLRSLCDRLPSASATLLRNLLERSLSLAGGAAEIREAICRLATSTPLEFFNTITSHEQIMLRIQDDPSFQKAPPGAYGIGETVAKRILKTRDALPDKRFTSIQQIDDIFGIGKDKIRDIYYSLTRDAQHPDYDRLLRETLDLCTHRLDAWISSRATKKLEQLRKEKPSGIYLGAYGWLEYLKPSETGKSAGYIHAPSAAQAATAAVLYNAYLTHEYNEIDAADGSQMSPNPFRINLNSERVRKGLSLLEGIRQGQTLGALLGYQFERALFDESPQIDAPDNMNLAEYVDDFRAGFPLVANKETEAGDGESIEAIAARNVVDGLALARAWREVENGDLGRIVKELGDIDDPAKKEALNVLLNDLLESLDSVSDLLVHEGVYQAVQGNYDRGGAALEAASGNLTPPEIRSIRTPVSGRTFSQRVCLLFDESEVALTGSPGARSLAEPRIAFWFAQLLGNMNGIRCSVSFESGPEQEELSLPVSLADLEMAPVDFLYLSAIPPGGDETELDRRIKCFVRTTHGLSWKDPIVIDYTAGSGGVSSIADACEVGLHALNLLNGAGYLKPDSLARPSGSEAALFEKADIDELRARVEGLLAPLVSDVINGLREFTITGTTVVDEAFREGLAASIKNAWQFSVSIALLSGGYDEPVDELEQRRSMVCAELEKRRNAYEQFMLKAAAAGDDTNKVVSHLVEAGRALLGNSFILLPTFTIKTGSEFRSALVQGTIVPEGEAIRLWLCRTALTHEPLRDIDAFMMMAEAWTPSARDGVGTQLSFHVAQLPVDAADGWLGMEQASDATLAEYQGETLSLVTAWSQYPEAPASGELRVAGILLDQWEEFLPSERAHTSVAFHYNAPNTQAPQSLLLAVPDTISQEAWNHNDLAAILSDTLDLAKIRTVDIDALRDIPAGNYEKPDMGMILPGILLPADSEKPGWERDTVLDTFQNWIDALAGKVSCMDFSGFTPLYAPWLDLPIGINGFSIDAVADEVISLPIGLTMESEIVMLYTRSRDLTVELPHETDLVKLRMGWLPEIEPIRYIQAFNAVEEMLAVDIVTARPEKVRLMLDLVNADSREINMMTVNVYGPGIKKLKVLAVSPDENAETSRIMAIQQICVLDSD